MISSIESRSVDKKKITFLTSSINADTLDILRSDQSSKLFRFSEDGEHIELAFKQMDNQIAYIPLEKSDRTSLTPEVQGALSSLKQDMIKEIVVAYSNSNFDHEHRFGEYTDDNENYSENIPSRLTEDGYVHEEDYVRHPASEYLPDDTDLYSDEYESVDHEIAENYSENIPSKMTEDGYVFGDEDDGNPIFKSELSEAILAWSYNADAGAYDIKLYNDYDLYTDERDELIEAGILQTEADGRQALVFQADIRAYTDELLFFGYDANKITNPDIRSYLDDCMSLCENDTILRQAILDSAETVQHMNVQPDIHTPVVHSPYKSDAELLTEFDVISAEDSYAKIKIRNADLVTEGISDDVLDELDHQDFLYTDSNNAAILRVDIDVDGSVVSPEYNYNFDKLSNEAKDTITAIHNEFSQELEIVIGDHEKREREADVLSHHHFLSDQKIHKTGYMLLEVKGDVWKEFSVKDNIYIEKCSDCYKIGSLDETKARYAEKTLGMALRAAVVAKEDIDVEKAKEVERQKQAQKANSDVNKSVQIAVG
ncbi:hypothetical protein [Brucella gallinifaecis]|uniref:hypothetical protein n=1 Tax=Brucella gallinifaecis TaxID=215590 RepID=UPI0023602B8F|nr:hypothetical protein [Brucella gallinifaecis]